MKYIWQDLEKPLNCFTVRSATMINLDTSKIIQHYSANTKIVVTQKCLTDSGTYYRTSEAAKRDLNYAFKASAFGLPNEIAPSGPFYSPMSNPLKDKLHAPMDKTNTVAKVAFSEGGERKQHKRWLSKLLRRKNG